MSAPGLVFTSEFREALSLLSLGSNMFLTGKAGTGKSTLIRHFMSETDRRVVVAAPTGIAALNVGGYTLHRLFGFSPTTTLDDVLSGAYRPARFRRTLASLDTLIVDEASMVRADLFDMIVAALEKYGPRHGEPYGGVQVVLVGDLFQLPPVVTEYEREYFSTRYASPYFFSGDKYVASDFPSVSLTTVFRQLGDTRLTSILNSIREGVLLTRARDELNARTRSGFDPPDDEFWLTLAPTNRVVLANNRRRLAALPAQEHVSVAETRGELDAFDPPTEHRLTFKEGAQIMMLNNDPGDRWVNGTIGRITDVRTENGHPGAVRVLFRDGTAAWAEPHTWEITRPAVVGGALRHEVIGAYTQLPFKLAWAITIHKSQGQTLDRLVVDLTGGTFDYGQVYVALSRCTSMEGLVLRRDVLAKDLKIDRRVVRFLHTATARPLERRYCGIGLLTVGEEGRMSRPRPVEIAVAFEDGTALTTLVNPRRDLGTARQDFGIAVDDVLLAPTLAEAWSLIGPAVAGWTPVGFDVDFQLGLVDFELKRLGHAAPLPLAVDVGRGRSTGRPSRALEVARAALTAFDAGTVRRGSTIDAAAGVFPDPADVDPEGLHDPDVSYLLTRDPDAPAPAPSNLPGLASILEVSRTVGAVLLDDAGASGPLDAGPGSGRSAVPRHRSAGWRAAVHRAVAALGGTGEVPAPGVERTAEGWTDAARHAVAHEIAVAAARVRLTPRLEERLRILGGVLGADVLPPDHGEESGQDLIEAVLVPGARVCFTGSVIDTSGRSVSKQELAELCERHGLAAVATVTKTRCEVLVVAELGTQSSKARKAQEYGKPVFSAGEFYAWMSRVRV